ncbi:hypothetical protein PsYK624_130670 [Phanerochaete sordida]|uniref:Uncharacterized protein n=1 Tax=Phanerochaete sordida TaxID=48140 RepID=A0A9P3GKF5_9APHY|nr:hypothetical protein PsYK624_130670 [Phanerochaete sordida]
MGSWRSQRNLGVARLRKEERWKRYRARRRARNFGLAGYTSATTTSCSSTESLFSCAWHYSAWSRRLHWQFHYRHTLSMFYCHRPATSHPTISDALVLPLWVKTYIACMLGAAGQHEKAPARTKSPTFPHLRGPSSPTVDLAAVANRCAWWQPRYSPSVSARCTRTCSRGPGEHPTAAPRLKVTVARR